MARCIMRRDVLARDTKTVIRPEKRSPVRPLQTAEYG